MGGSAEHGDELVGRHFGEFVVRERIGEGGFAEVFRADQPALHREAVIKVLHARHATRPQVVARFLREARLSSQLDHPYAAHIYAFGAETDGKLWIAMELVRGTPMDKLLAAQGPISLERFVPFFDRVCDVVHSAHEQGIVHRDIKPANLIVLSRAGRLLPKLLDFGIARVLDDPSGAIGELGDGDGDGDGARTTRADGILGSPLFMAPEQWRDPGAAGKPADIYALGALCYEALTGRAPFDGQTLEQVAAAHARGAVAPPEEQMPERVTQAILRALAKDPQDRYATAIDLAAALRDAAGLRDDGIALPQFEERLRSALLADAPQPLAETVATLEAARNVDQACALLGNVVSVAVRWLGILALAARARIGSGRQADRDETRSALQALARGVVSDREWLELAGMLTRPFVDYRDAYPIPELVTLLHGDDGDRDRLATSFLQLEQLRAEFERGARRSEDQRRDLYVESLRALADFVRCFLPLFDYTLVVTRAKRCEQWRGLRRSPRAPFIRRARPLPEGEPMLIDAEGAAVLQLSPLVQVAPPTAGAADELFVFEGRGQLGARLIAMPDAFEHTDPDLWEWFHVHLFDPREASHEVVPSPQAPYRGLAPFTVDDAAFYFGREREVEAFVNRLRVEPLLVVVGPSGSGKSSFVHAGVLPALPAGWRAISLRPGPAPMAALASCLSREGIEAAGLAEDPDALGDSLRSVAKLGGRVVVVVDQLEELLTLCRDPLEHMNYAAAIASAARSPDDPVRVVLTLRDDFLLQAEQLAPFRNRLSRAIKLLTTPAPEDLERIVVEPARRAGYEFETKELVREIVGEVAGLPGALALLSFTAAELWKLRDRNFSQLTRKAYRAIGGVAGALARHADDSLEAMTQDEQRMVREAFRHLVTAEGTRQVLWVAELTQLLGGGPRAASVIERLVGARLLVTSEPAAGERGQSDEPVEQIEVIHEALLEAWPRLVKWRREDAENARLRDQLRTAARQWHERGQAPGLLWRDEAVTEYRLWRARYPGALTDVEQAFASASLAEAARGRRRRRMVLSVSFATLAIVAAVMSALGVSAVRSAATARERLLQSYFEHGREALVSGQSTAALVYLAAVHAMGWDSPALTTMLGFAAAPLRAQQRSLTGHKGNVWSAEFSPDGRFVVTAGADRTARIWNSADGRLVATLTGHDDAVLDAAFSPDGSRVITVSQDSSARIWDVDGRPRSVLRADGPVVRAAFRTDGERVATVGVDAVARIWRVETGDLVHALTGHEAEINDVAYDHSGTRLATASADGTARIWDAESGRVLAVLGHDDDVQSVSFRPDGTRLVTASWDGTARIWDSSSGALVATLAGHGERVEQAVFSPDGTLVATAGRDDTARVWDGGTGALISVLRGHLGMVNFVQFDASSARIATASDDRSARLWDARTGRPLASFEGHGAAVLEVRFRPDGRELVTASWDGSAKLWRASDLYLTARWPAQAGRCRDAVPTRDGHYVAIACDVESRLLDTRAGTVTVLPAAQLAFVDPTATRVVTISDRQLAIWDTAGNPVRSLPADDEIAVASWSVDGRIIAAGTVDGQLIVWDTVSGERRVARREHETAIVGVAFRPDGSLVTASRSSIHVGATVSPSPAQRIDISPPGLEWMITTSDGRRVVGGGPGSRVRVWDLDSGDVIDLVGHAGVVLGTGLDARERLLATASGDGTARIWELKTGRLVATLMGSPQFLKGADFDPTGELVVTIGGDGAIRFWEVSSGKLLFQLAAHRSFGLLVKYTGPHQLTTVGREGEIMLWTLPDEAGPPATIDRLLACRSTLPARSGPWNGRSGDALVQVPALIDPRSHGFGRRDCVV